MLFSSIEVGQHSDVHEDFGDAAGKEIGVAAALSSARPATSSREVPKPRCHVHALSITVAMQVVNGGAAASLQLSYMLMC